MIERIIIKNYKGIKYANIVFNEKRNIIVGDNGVGKSTVIEAMSLALGYVPKNFELTQYHFNSSCWEDYKSTHQFPKIEIELYFQNNDNYTEFTGKNNSLHIEKLGVRLRFEFDNDRINYIKEEDNYIPCEFYKKTWTWFSDDPVKQFLLPFSVQIIDSSTSFFNTRTNQFITRLINSNLSIDEVQTLKYRLREMKSNFDDKSEVRTINEKLTKYIEESIDEGLSISVELSSRMAWETVLGSFLGEIPLSQIGLGELCVVKTLISLIRKENDKQKIVIIEEPESHLSHTKMYELLSLIEEKHNGQIFITTHNSFVANRLNLRNLIVLNNDDGKLISVPINYELEELKEAFNFFSKMTDYHTLRLALCKSAILVEGPTDEMIVNYSFMKRGENHLAERIEVISVGGTKFKNYVSLAKLFRKKMAIITDNDGKTKEKIKLRYEADGVDFIQAFTADEQDNYSIEPAFVHANSDRTEQLKAIIYHGNNRQMSQKELIDFMEDNKSEWAFRLLESNDLNFNVPQYIETAIDWILNNNGE